MGRHPPTAIVVILALFASGCQGPFSSTEDAAFTEATEGSVQVRVLPAESGVRLELTNVSEQPLVLIALLDPVYEVTHFTVKDSRGRACPLKTAADWLAAKDDLETIPPGKALSQVVPLEHFGLKPGTYRIQVRYTVLRESFFVAPWLKDMITDRTKAKTHRPRMEALWFGTAVSPVTEVQLKNPGDANKSRRPSL